MPDLTTLTPAQRRVLEVMSDGKQHNYYSAGGVRMHTFRSLLARGLIIGEVGSPWHLPQDLYRITEAGRAALREDA